MLKLEDLIKQQQLKFYFKFNEGSLPVYLENWDITPNAHVHNYNTREVKHEFATTKLSNIICQNLSMTPQKELNIRLIRIVYKVL